MAYDWFIFQLQIKCSPNFRRLWKFFFSHYEILVHSQSLAQEIFSRFFHILNRDLDRFCSLQQEHALNWRRKQDSSPVSAFFTSKSFGIDFEEIGMTKCVKNVLQIRCHIYYYWNDPYLG